MHWKRRPRFARSHVRQHSSPRGRRRGSRVLRTSIGVVDDDVVDESNLQRQIIHSTAALGVPKVDSAAERIAGINPSASNFDLAAERSTTFRLTAANALELIREYDLVVDGSDNFPTRYLVNDACVLRASR